MGQARNTAIEEFQERSGITPERGKRLDTLCSMQMAALELICIIELEKSGIRDGDGYWGGSDPLYGAVQKLRDLYTSSRSGAS